MKILFIDTPEFSRLRAEAFKFLDVNGIDNLDQCPHLWQQFIRSSIARHTRLTGHTTNDIVGNNTKERVSEIFDQMHAEYLEDYDAYYCVSPMHDYENDEDNLEITEPEGILFMSEEGYSLFILVHQ